MALAKHPVPAVVEVDGNATEAALTGQVLREDWRDRHREQVMELVESGKTDSEVYAVFGLTKKEAEVASV